MTTGSVLAAFDRPASRRERMAIEVARAIQFANATLTSSGDDDPNTALGRRVAALKVLADHDRTLRSRFGHAYALEAKERGYL